MSAPVHEIDRPQAVPTTTSKSRESVMAVLSEFVTVYVKVYVPGEMLAKVKVGITNWVGAAALSKATVEPSYACMVEPVVVSVREYCRFQHSALGVSRVTVGTARDTDGSFCVFVIGVEKAPSVTAT